MAKFLCLLPVLGAFVAGQAIAQEVPPLSLANAYITGLSQLEAAREAGENETARDKASSPNNSQIQFSDCVHGMTAMQLTLTNFSVDVGLVGSSKTGDQPKQLILSYNKSLQNMYKDFGDTCDSFLQGPKPGVDYGALGAKFPKIRAFIEETQNSYIQMSAIVFGGLLNLDREDSEGHANHLLITRAQRDDLVELIETDFGDKLRQPHPTAFVSAALVMEGYLQKGFKGSDEPWQ